MTRLWRCSGLLNRGFGGRVITVRIKTQIIHGVFQHDCRQHDGQHDCHQLVCPHDCHQHDCQYNCRQHDCQHAVNTKYQHAVNTTVNTLLTRLSTRCQHHCQHAVNTTVSTTVNTLSARLSRRLSARCQHDCGQQAAGTVCGAAPSSVRPVKGHGQLRPAVLASLWEEDPIPAVATCRASVERTEVRDWEEDPIPAVATCVGRVLSARRSGTGKRRTLSLQWPRVLGEC